MKSKRRRLGLILLVVLLCVIFCRPLVIHISEKEFLVTGPNGPETPASLGVPFERLKIASGDRQLDGFLVRASPTCQPQIAVLIFHGVGETISQWVKAQQFLHEHCVSSIVFDYSGHGDSTKPGTFRNLREDAVAAYRAFAVQFAGYGRRCVFGFSMGNGPMLESITNLRPQPSCVIVAAAFSSLRDAGARRGSPKFVLYLIPDIWDNVEAVSRNHAPLLVVHGDVDSVNPVSMGQRIFDAAPEPKEIVVLHGFQHNAPYVNPVEEWWKPALQFMKGEGSAQSGLD